MGRATRRHIPAAGCRAKPARLSVGVKDTDCGGHGTAGIHHFPAGPCRTCLYRGRRGAALPHTFGYGRLHVFRMGACQAVKANRQEPHGRALHHRPEQFRPFPRGKRRASGRNGFRSDGKVRDLPESEGDMPELVLLLYAGAARCLQPGGREGADRAAQPVQTCLYRYRQDRQTRRTTENHPSDTGTPT